MPKNSLLLFALEHSHVLGNAIAQQLGLALAPHEERVFEDGEHKARPLQSVRGRSCFVLHSLYGEPAQSVNDKLTRLLFFIATLKDAAAKEVTAVVPYLAYARKDRKTQPRDPVTLRYLAQLFEAVGTDALLVLEVHNPAAFQNAFRCSTETLDCTALFAQQLVDRLGDSAVTVVSPDAGGVKRAALFRQNLAHSLGRSVTMGFVEKFRSAGVLSGELLVGEVSGRHVLLFDDLISSGQTLLRAARACHQQGATAVWALAAHGLFNADAASVLSDPMIERVFITDSVPLRLTPGSALANKLEVVSCADLLAEAIRRCHEGGSIVELMQG
ncbi:MAG: ribose-phosphate pyrophosphokinase [Oxalobacteraceae bacterium]|nr:ribose-phosphate pyrophosphokinase [Oxalobacteraceae bacterium]